MSVREGLLALLIGGPKHGYQLRQEFEQSTAGHWPLNIGQVYSTLDRLQRDGLVEAATGESDRRVVRITEAGRRELGDWFSTPVEPSPARDSLVMKVLIAVETAGVDVREVIDVQRTALVDHLQQQRRRQRKLPTEGLSAADVLESLMGAALISRLEADLRWLDACEQVIATHLPKGR
jgi:DNA-binding PadR family transcriptional regulator